MVMKKQTPPSNSYIYGQKHFGTSWLRSYAWVVHLSREDDNDMGFI